MDPTFYPMNSRVSYTSSRLSKMETSHLCVTASARDRRVDLQFLCMPRTRVRGLLNFLPPAMPIMIGNSFDSPTPHSTLSLEDGSQVVAAFEQRDRVSWLHLQDPLSALLEKLTTTMQETSSGFGRPMRLRLCLSSPRDTWVDPPQVSSHSCRGESHFLNYPSFFCPRMISSIFVL